MALAALAWLTVHIIGPVVSCAGHSWTLPGFPSTRGRAANMKHNCEVAAVQAAGASPTSRDVWCWIFCIRFLVLTLQRRGWTKCQVVVSCKS